jgi:SAM-dependent methyltransferase
MRASTLEPVVASYTRLAPFYDTFTKRTDHEPWLRGIEQEARALGLGGRDLLDVACGTGRSLRPLVELGYRGQGCDIAAPMLAIARSRLPGIALWQADMRKLPDVGRFHWITCLNDAINYLLGEDDLTAALSSMATLLHPGGLVTFDVTTLTEHRGGFDSTWVVEEPDAYLCWQGRGCADAPGEPGVADIDIFVRRDGSWTRDVSRHAQRWWGPDDVRRAARAAGLEMAGRFGTAPSGSLEADTDESRYRKLVYFLRRPGASDGEEVAP